MRITKSIVVGLFAAFLCCSSYAETLITKSVESDLNYGKYFTRYSTGEGLPCPINSVFPRDDGWQFINFRFSAPPDAGELAQLDSLLLSFDQEAIDVLVAEDVAVVADLAADLPQLQALNKGAWKYHIVVDHGLDWPAYKAAFKAAQ